MYVDAQNLYSSDQAITATAASTNVIDHLDADHQVMDSVELVAVVTEAFSGGTSVQFALQSDTADTFGSAATIIESPAIAVASLTAGYQVRLGKLPHNIGERYTRMYYTVVGTPSAGKITAFLTPVRDSNN